MYAQLLSSSFSRVWGKIWSRHKRMWGKTTIHKEWGVAEILELECTLLCLSTEWICQHGGCGSRENNVVTESLSSKIGWIFYHQLASTFVTITRQTTRIFRALIWSPIMLSALLANLKARTSHLSLPWACQVSFVTLLTKMKRHNFLTLINACMVSYKWV